MPFLIIIPIVLIIILAVYLKRPETRGKRGENRVKWVIGETIENEQYVEHFETNSGAVIT